MHPDLKRLLLDCADALSRWFRRLVPAGRRICLSNQRCVEGSANVTQSTQHPLRAEKLRSQAQRLCGKEGWARHHCSPPLNAIASGAFKASSCHWQ